MSAKDSMSNQPQWKAALTLNFHVAQDQNKVTKMLCNGAQLQFVPASPSSPKCSEPKYEMPPPSPSPSPISPRRLKAAGRPPNLPLPELPERWVNHYGLMRSNGIYGQGQGQGQGRQGMGSKFMFNCNNGAAVHDYHHHYQSMEQSISQVYASVMLYDDNRRQWLPSGGTHGMARVHIYQHQSDNKFRVVGRLMSDQSVVINCAILKGLKYNQATTTFHQWRDSKQVYGLNFQSPDDAQKFAMSMMDSLEQLQQTPPRPSPPVPQPPAHHQNHQNGPAEDPRIRLDSNSHQAAPPQASVPEVPRTAPPAAPPAPPVPQGAPPVPQGGPPVPQGGPPQPPQTSPQNSVPVPPGAPPAAPPAPPGPPPPPGGPGGPPAPPGPPGAAPGAPPPPPPPPPPGAGGGPPKASSGGGNDLASQLANTKLRKAAPKPDNGGDAPAKRPGGPGGMSMMADLQRKLAARQIKSEGGAGDSGSSPSKEKVSPPEQSRPSEPKTTTKPWEKKNITNGIAPGSPRTLRRSSIKESASSNGSADNVDFDRMKQEIMTEMRKEISKMKEEIIDAIKMELNRR